MRCYRHQPQLSADYPHLSLPVHLIFPSLSLSLSSRVRVWMYFSTTHRRWRPLVRFLLKNMTSTSTSGISFCLLVRNVGTVTTCSLLAAWNGQAAIAFCFLSSAKRWLVVAVVTVSVLLLQLLLPYTGDFSLRLFLSSFSRSSFGFCSSFTIARLFASFDWLMVTAAAPAATATISVAAAAAADAIEVARRRAENSWTVSASPSSSDNHFSTPDF